MLTLVASPAGLREVWFPNKGEQSRRDGEQDDPSHPTLAAAAVQLGEYFAGTRQRFDLPSTRRARRSSSPRGGR